MTTVWFGAGLVTLVAGAELLVRGASGLARAFGIPPLLIGLTVVAFGTSTPEMVVSVVAALDGRPSLAVGNVVGSNIFNILGILGLTGLLAGGRLPIDPAIGAFDLPVMAAVALACLPLFASGHRINRWEGGLFFGYYVAYTTYLVLASTAHDALPQMSLVMLEFVLPLTMATLAVVAWRVARQGSSPRTAEEAPR